MIQPTHLSNIGRWNTLVRFIIEQIISRFSGRYDICKKMPWYILDVSGLVLRFISSVHCHFEIGKLRCVVCIFCAF